MNSARFLTRSDAATEGLAKEAAALGPWFHNLHLPDGTQTAPNHPLGDFPSTMWDQIKGHLPDDLNGWSALEIGCNSGFYALELARRGARVTGVDVDPHFLTQARWAAEQFSYGDRIEFRQAQIYDLAHWDGTFDLVLFMGVFYHLRYPLLGLDIVAEKTQRLMVFQTLSMPGEEVADVPEDQDFDDRSAFLEPGWPKMAFIEKSLAGDPTNWWAPNHAAIEAMLRSSSLQVSARAGHEVYLCTPAATALPATREQNRAQLEAATGRHSSS